MRLQSYRIPARKISKKPLILGMVLLLVTAASVGHLVFRAYTYLKRFERRFQEHESAVKEYAAVHLQHIIYKRSPNDQAFPVQSTSVAAATYIRWGRSNCPSKTGTSLVYHGYAGGSYYSHTGGGSDFLCLHHNVTYTPGHYVEGNHGNSYIYGVEFRDAPSKNSLFDLSLIEQRVLQYQGVPCALCLVQSPVQVMIPSRETCPEGWRVEYTGYIMTGSYSTSKHSSSHLCVDDQPQAVQGSQGNQGCAYLFTVEVECGYNIPCEPYVHYREVRCVVCAFGF